MGPLRAVVIREQNPQKLNGDVFVDTAVYATAAQSLTIRSGREASTYIMAGTQTSSLTTVALDLANAASGDQITVKRYSTAAVTTGAGQIQIVSGSGAGAILGSIQTGTAAVNAVTAVFDGVNQVWR